MWEARTFSASARFIVPASGGGRPMREVDSETQKPASPQGAGRQTLRMAGVYGGWGMGSSRKQSYLTLFRCRNVFSIESKTCRNCKVSVSGHPLKGGAVEVSRKLTAPAFGPEQS